MDEQTESPLAPEPLPPPAQPPPPPPPHQLGNVSLASTLMPTTTTVITTEVVTVDRSVIPTSVCSLPCKAGQIMIMNTVGTHAVNFFISNKKYFTLQGDTCCWVCQKCQPFEFVKDVKTCEDCGRGRWPMKNYSTCYELEQQVRLIRNIDRNNRCRISGLKLKHLPFFSTCGGTLFLPLSRCASAARASCSPSSPSPSSLRTVTRPSSEPPGGSSATSSSPASSCATLTPISSWPSREESSVSYKGNIEASRAACGDGGRQRSTVLHSSLVKYVFSLLSRIISLGDTRWDKFDAFARSMHITEEETI
jgi:hypothetical protein